ncbi:MAG: hypothetical protein ACREU6_12000 [Steroidobacteraceae bacterium]
MRLRRLMPVLMLSLLHGYIGLLPDPAASSLLLVSFALMLMGLKARSIRPGAMADRWRPWGCPS